MAQVKTPKEIEYIKTACEITDQIFTEVLAFIKKDKNRTETQVQDFIMTAIKKRRLRPSFPAIVASGAHAGSEIHPKPTNKKLQGFTIIDLGVRYDGYCSDMTRMVYVGEPSQKELDIYQIVLDAQLLGVKLSRAGIECSLVDASVRSSLGIYKRYFIHTLGHGVGRKIHEQPRLYEKYIKPILKEEMVVTIEPGIYIPKKLGIRIEDTIVITKKIPIILTKTSKKLVCIS